MHDVVLGTNQFDDLTVKAVSTFEENVEMRQGLTVGSATNPDDFRIRSRVRTVIAADFDNDGWEEIFVNNIPGSNRLFQKTSVGGEWAWRNIGDALEPMGYGTGAAVVDFDGDGRLELVV